MQGADYPECRPYFKIEVGPDEQMEDVWSIDVKSVSLEDTHKNINERFRGMETDLEVMSLTRVLFFSIASVRNNS